MLLICLLKSKWKLSSFRKLQEFSHGALELRSNEKIQNFNFEAKDSRRRLFSLQFMSPPAYQTQIRPARNSSIDCVLIKLALYAQKPNY